MLTVFNPIMRINPYLDELKKTLQKIADTKPDVLYQKIVDAPFSDPLYAARLDLGIVVLLLVDPLKKMIDRIALSNTTMAEGAVKMSAKPFKSIKIPLDHQANIIAQSIKRHETTKTSDWKHLFVPALTAQQARLNQSGAGVETSLVHPLDFRHGGAMIFSFYQPAGNLAKHHFDFVRAYAKFSSETLTRLLGD